MRKPDVAYSVIKTHTVLKKQALSAFKRFLHSLDLTVEKNDEGKKELVVVEESTEEEEQEQMTSGSEDEVEEQGGGMGKRMAL